MYNTEAYLENNGLEVVKLERVLKIAHGVQETEEAVARLKIADPQKRDDKVFDLMEGGRTNIYNAVLLAAKAPDISILFGNPKLAADIRPEWWRDTYHMAYVQDLVHPIADLLAKLDLNNNSVDQKIACRLVDNYIQAQIRMICHKLYDPDYKFADNCGLSALDAEFKGPGGDFMKFRVIDPGELDNNLGRLLASIRAKEWRKIPKRSEYTPLHPFVQNYLFEQLESRFTEGVVRYLWGISHSDHLSVQIPRNQAIQVINGRMFDTNIPHDLPSILWERRRQQQQAQKR